MKFSKNLFIVSLLLIILVGLSFFSETNKFYNNFNAGKSLLANVSVPDFPVSISDFVGGKNLLPLCNSVFPTPPLILEGSFAGVYNSQGDNWLNIKIPPNMQGIGDYTQILVSWGDDERSYSWFDTFDVSDSGISFNLKLSHDNNYFNQPIKISARNFKYCNPDGKWSVWKENNPITQTRALSGETIFLLGGRDESDVLNFFPSSSRVLSSVDGLNWHKISDPSPWRKRSSHSSVFFNNKIWVLAGTDAEFNPYDKLEYEDFDDVWSSSNGVEWKNEKQQAPWGKRTSQSVVVFNNRMYLAGGSHLNENMTRIKFNDVWQSSNGYDWSMVTGKSKWMPRHGQSLVVFKDRMWLIGGDVGDAYYTPQNDVWSSADGKDWRLEIANAPWSARSQHTVVVFKDRMWVIGGGFNDVWSSADGKDWRLEIANAPWPLRWGHTSFVFDNKIWIVGGFNYYPGVETDYSDAWSSVDGVSWFKETSTIPGLLGEGVSSVVVPYPLSNSSF